MLNDISHLGTLSLNILLSDAINKQIIGIVHDCILKSKRFQVQ